MHAFDKRQPKSRTSTSVSVCILRLEGVRQPLTMQIQFYLRLKEGGAFLGCVDAHRLGGVDGCVGGSVGVYSDS